MLNTKTILTLLLSLCSFLGLAQVPWTVIPTGSEHNILIVTENLSPDSSKTLELNDYIGFFYESSPGNYDCAGLVRNTGADTLYATIYGDDGVDPGFAFGETIRAVFWDSTQACQTSFATLTTDFGPSIFIDGASTVIIEMDISAIKVDYGNTTFARSDILLSPIARLDDKKANTTNLSIFSKSTGLNTVDSALIDLATSTTNLHYVVFRADQCLLEDSIAFDIQDLEIPWSYQPSLSSESKLNINTIKGLNNGDAIGAFYDSLGTLYSGGYSIYDGQNLSVRAMGYTPNGNAGFKTEQQLGSLQEIVLQVWDSENECLKGGISAFSEGVQTSLYYYADSVVAIDSIQIGPLPSISLEKEVYTENDHNPVFIVPNEISDWSIADYSSGILINSNNEIDLGASSKGDHFVVVDAHECLANDTIYFQIDKEEEEEVILAPSSPDEKYQSFYIPNEGEIKILDRNGLVVKRLQGPDRWYGDGDKYRLPSGDYFVQCEDGTTYIISIVK